MGLVCIGSKFAAGILQVWGVVDKALVPLVRIGDRVAPALRLIVCEPLGLLITAHNGGWACGIQGPAAWKLVQPGGTTCSLQGLHSQLGGSGWKQGAASAQRASCRDCSVLHTLAAARCS